MRSASTRSALWGAASLLLFNCNEQTTPIRELLDDPQRFDGRVVRIAGEVREALGALGYGSYQVTDGTGTLRVVSEEGGAPTSGSRVGVEGTFHAAYTLGEQSGAVLVERRRFRP